MEKIIFYVLIILLFVFCSVDNSHMNDRKCLQIKPARIHLIFHFSSPLNSATICAQFLIMPLVVSSRNTKKTRQAHTKRIWFFAVARATGPACLLDLFATKAAADRCPRAIYPARPRDRKQCPNAKCQICDGIQWRCGAVILFAQLQWGALCGDTGSRIESPAA